MWVHVHLLTASWLPLSVKYLYQAQKSEFCLYQLMFLRLRISLLCDAAAAALSWMLSPAEGRDRKKREGTADPRASELTWTPDSRTFQWLLKF